jgi:hypothetical protein
MKKFARWLFIKYYSEEIELTNELVKARISLSEIPWQRGVRQALYTLELLQDK